MGFDVAATVQRGYLTALGCRIEGSDDDEAWTVHPPSWRFDLSLEEDLIEEVARLHGYEHVGTTRPDLAFTPSGVDATHRGLRTWLADAGLQETIGYVFTGDDEIARSRAPKATVRLSNPQGIERARLRTALYPGLLAAAATNRGEGGVAFFEVGRTFEGEERERLAIVLAGAWDVDGWRQGTTVDLWRLKGVVERYAAVQNSVVQFVPADPATVPMLHSGVAARVTWNGRDVGFAGRVHPEVERAFEVDGAFVLEVDLPLEPRRLAVQEIPRQPFAERDVAVVASSDVPYAHLERLVRGAAGDALVECFPFDVYAGPPLEDGTRSVALRLRWRHPERALRDSEVDVWFARVVDELRARGYELRG
jgi:phenylalanyl-tRNA synthetase beta chain